VGRRASADRGGAAIRTFAALRVRALLAGIEDRAQGASRLPAANAGAALQRDASGGDPFRASWSRSPKIYADGRRGLTPLRIASRTGDSASGIRVTLTISGGCSRTDC
jgi:hypothetical protein